MSLRQCPRCKSQLSKTRNDKIACKVCGFVAKQLEVAANNEEFQERQHFTKKITFREPDLKNKQNGQQQPKHHYVFTFQNMLKDAANSLFQSNPTLTNIEAATRQTWLQYLKATEKNRLKIIGIFAKLNKNQKEVQKNQNHQEEEGEDEYQQKKERRPPAQEQEERKIGEEQKNLSQHKIQIKGKKKKAEQEVSLKKEQFSSQVKRKILTVNKSNQPKKQKIVQIMNFFMIEEQQTSKDDIDYCSRRYVEFLTKLQRKQKSTKTETNRVGVRQLRVLLEQRKEIFGASLMKVMADPNSRFGKTAQIMKMILMMDMLSFWCSKQELTASSLDTCIGHYEDGANENKIKLITFLLEQFKGQIKNELLERNSQGLATKSGPIPELSFTLVYAILYCACIREGYTLSIEDIVIGCGTLKMQYKGVTVLPEERITNFKIRQTASLLFRFIGLADKQHLKYSLPKWVRKYCEVCGVQDQCAAICILADALYEGHLLKKKNKKDSLLNQRYDILEQDEIAKSCIIIYCKLQLGFDQTPFLATFPKQLLNFLKISPDYQEFLQRVLERRDKVINLFDVLSSLEEYQKNRALESKVYYPSSSYESLSGLNCLQLAKYIKMCPYTIGNMKLAASITACQTQFKHLTYSIATNMQQKHLKLSQSFTEEVNYARRAESRGRQYLNQLDLPAANYQILYEYLTNIRHLNRKLFVYFAESIAGENRLKDIFEWLEKLERSIVDFQN